MKLGKVSEEELQEWWDREKPFENLSAFSVYLRLNDDTHFTVEFSRDEENKRYKVVSMRQYWFCYEEDVVRKLKEFKFGKDIKKKFEGPTYVNYVNWFEYAVERIANPMNQFTVEETIPAGEHKVVVMYLSELHATRFYVKETLTTDFDDVLEACVEAKAIINSWVPEAKLIKIEGVRDGQPI